MPSFKIKSLIIAALLVCLTPSGLTAKEVEKIPPGLDFERRLAVSKRFELSPYGGDFLGEKLNHSFIVGANLQYNFTPALAISTDFGYSRAAVDRTSALGATWTDNDIFLVDESFVWTLPALLRSGKGQIEADFFTSVGGGLMRSNGGNRFGGFVGGGLKIRPNISWLAFRVEVRNYFTSIPNPVGSDFEYVLNFRLGPTFLLPPRMKK